MTETWYVCEDNTAVHPNDVAPDKDGALRTKDGRAVAMRGDVPRSRSVDPDAERSKTKAKIDQAKAKADREKAEPEQAKAKAEAERAAKDMKPQPSSASRSTYLTREVKTED